VTTGSQLQTEIARKPCDVGQQNIDSVERLREWDGRQIILGYGFEQVGFCSKSYIATFKVQGYWDMSVDLRGDVQVFDRHSLLPHTKK
jgi:hypothetical protein